MRLPAQALTAAALLAACSSAATGPGDGGVDGAAPVDASAGAGGDTPPAPGGDGPPATGAAACDGFRAIAAGETLTCALENDGTVWCWGKGPVGDGSPSDRPLPARVGTFSDATQIAVGRWHACARRGDGSVWCWGRNAMGQVDASKADQPAPVPSGAPAAIAVAASGRYSCALSAEGSITCWGERPVAPVGETKAIEMALGDEHACFRTMDRVVWCLGSNVNGELGLGTIGGAFTRIPARSLMADAVAIDGGTLFTVALRQDETVWWWGWDAALGKMGTPTQVAGLTGVAGVSAGHQHSCAVTTQGNVRCWGLGSNGRLGGGTTDNATAPVAVALDAVVQVSAGYTHTCAVVKTGAAYCWGYNDVGQLGNGTSIQASRPVRVCGSP